MTLAITIKTAKVQSTILTRKNVARKGREKDDSAEDARFKLILGTYVEFNDGWIIHGPDGRVHTGTSTVVRFNYHHQSWSVQRPQRCATDRMGYVFTARIEPVWLKPERESGISTAEFRRNFSRSFVQLCLDAQGMLDGNAAAGGPKAA